MKIRFQFRRYRLPLRFPVRTAHGVWKEREGLIVRVEGEGRGAEERDEGKGRGAIGFGEVAPIPEFGTETVDEDEAGARALGEWTSNDAVAQLPKRLACLRNAVAAAIAEVQGASAGGEGTGHASTLGIAALLPAGKAALAQIPARSEIGFRVFKWKVGVADVAEELPLFDDVCAALPSGGRLRLDANGAWDRRRAERWLERSADRPVEFVEQPIAAEARGAPDLLLGLAGDYPTPIALDESLVSDGDVERWIGAGWPGVFVVKPALFGDVAETMARLAKAKAAVVFSSALETAVGARAALQVAFAWSGEKRTAGFGVWPLFADARFDGPVAAPFVRVEDLQRIDAEAVWNALT